MVGEGKRRVLALLETHWDRKQLEACRERWDAELEVVFPEPDDVSCPYDFDPLDWIERAVAGSSAASTASSARATTPVPPWPPPWPRASGSPARGPSG